MDEGFCWGMTKFPKGRRECLKGGGHQISGGGSDPFVHYVGIQKRIYDAAKHELFFFFAKIVNRL